MPVLALLTDKTLKERKFFSDVRKRMKVGDMVKNPFRSEITMIRTDSKMITIMDIEPLYPTIIPKIGLFLIFVGIVFGWKVTIIGGSFLSLTFFLWTDRFFYLVLKKARRRQGIEGEIRLLPHKEALLGVAKEWGR